MALPPSPSTEITDVRQPACLSAALILTAGRNGGDYWASDYGNMLETEASQSHLLPLRSPFQADATLVSVPARLSGEALPPTPTQQDYPLLP